MHYSYKRCIINTERRWQKMVSKIKKTMLFPEDLLEKVAEFQEKNYLSSLTSAMIVLIVRGLELKDGDQ